MKRLMLFFAFVVVAAGGWWLVAGQPDKKPESNPIKTGQRFDKKQYSLNDPASLWVITNKRRPLQPTDYAPNDLTTPDVPLRLTAKDEEMKLRAEPAAALKTMFEAAKKEGVSLMVSSAYRSFSFQKGLYNRYVGQQGRTVADTQSARPGHSEHQTGLAVDVEPASRECEVETCFADTPEGKWTTEHAHEYGFIIRYGDGRQGITGYIYEPWHLRYVGKKLALEIHKQGNPTLEDFFGLEPAPDYGQ